VWVTKQIKVEQVQRHEILNPCTSVWT